MAGTSDEEHIEWLGELLNEELSLFSSLRANALNFETFDSFAR